MVSILCLLLAGAMIDNFLLMAKIHLHIEVIVVYPELLVRLHECGLVVA